MAKGKIVPDFKYEDPDGKLIDLSSFRGKFVLIDIWATWCGACVEELPKMIELEKEFKDRNIVFVGLSIDKADRKKTWLSFVKDRELPGVQVTTEGDMTFVNAVNMTIIPRYLLIDPEGKIFDADLPRPSNPGLKKFLNSIKGL